MIVKNNGSLNICPFRICRYGLAVNDNSEFEEGFMPCLKEKCPCYEKIEDDKRITEYCYRDNLGYERTTLKE